MCQSLDRKLSDRLHKSHTVLAGSEVDVQAQLAPCATSLLRLRTVSLKCNSIRKVPRHRLNGLVGQPTHELVTALFSQCWLSRTTKPTLGISAAGCRTAPSPESIFCTKQETWPVLTDSERASQQCHRGHYCAAPGPSVMQFVKLWLVRLVFCRKVEM